MIKQIEDTEHELILSMLKDIGGTNDPIEQFKAIERYHKFVVARANRIDGDMYYATSNRNTKG